tara:strand:- start:292 stop:516 length:225 start_codon:yes stop_codon:yes gene_type:complete
MENNSVQQIIQYLEDTNFRTEPQIQEDVFGFYRNETIASNKKYAEMLRRALDKGLIHRAKVNYQGCRYVYYVKN